MGTDDLLFAVIKQGYDDLKLLAKQYDNIFNNLEHMKHIVILKYNVHTPKRTNEEKITLVNAYTKRELDSIKYCIDMTKSFCRQDTVFTIWNSAFEYIKQYPNFCKTFSKEIEVLKNELS